MFKNGLFVSASVAVMLVMSACKDEPKSTRWDQAASNAASAAQAPSASAAPTETVAKTHGDDLNRYFPKDGLDGTQRVFTDESKKGTSIAKLSKEGKELATLAVNDAAGDEPALKKFAASTEKVSDSPVVKVGNNQTAALVKGRYQVKVSSTTLDHEARKGWIQKFDLSGLAALAEKSKP